MNNFKFADVLEIVNGRNQKQVECEDGKYPIYGSGGIMGWANDYICPAETVIIGRKGSINNPIYVDTPFWNVDTAFGLVADKSKLLPKYLYYFCCNFNFLALNTTVTIPSLTKANLLKIDIHIPTLQEQSAVVEKLDSVEKLINIKKVQKAEINNVVKSRFVEMFGDPNINSKDWKKEQLQNNATLLNGRAYKQDELLDMGKYPVLRVGNFFSNRGWYYSDLELEDDKYCDNGDLLYAWSASFGPKIWDGGKVIYHYHIWKIIVGEKYNKQFLCNLLDYSIASFMGDTHGIGMLHLTKSGMEQTEFIVPPIELQNQFADFVKQTDKLKLVAQQTLEELEKLKKSLMQKYFG